MHSNTLGLAIELISRESVTPDDAGCQQLLIKRLEKMGFECETMVFGEVSNLWARRGRKAPLLAFVGHTDVVPTGPLELWQSGPFKPEIRDGNLFGRGAADMKSSIAAMVVACENYISKSQHHRGSIAFLITSDEEGPARDGTIRVIQTLEDRGEKIDWALVGEPSSSKQLGDVVKNGRRGSIGASLIVNGRQGHVAYPQLANNPIHTILPALDELCQTHWDDGNAFFPASSFQISNINAGTGASNVIPGEIEVSFNLRYSTELNHQQIIQKVEGILNKHELDYSIEWNHSGMPFLTHQGELVEAAQKAIFKVTGLETELSTAGGTSDGRFIAPTGAQVLELGPINATIHQINERVNIADLDGLTEIYEEMLDLLLT